MPPQGPHCTATKLSAACPFTLEYPTTVPASFTPTAPLTVAPESVPRSFIPLLALQVNACCPKTVPVHGYPYDVCVSEQPTTSPKLLMKNPLLSLSPFKTP